jgi:hypothetical protein
MAERAFNAIFIPFLASSYKNSGGLEVNLLGPINKKILLEKCLIFYGCHRLASRPKVPTSSPVSSVGGGGDVVGVGANL